MTFCYRSMAVTSTVSLPADEVGFTELDELGLQKPAIGKRIILEVLERVKFNWSQSKQVFSMAISPALSMDSSSS